MIVFYAFLTAVIISAGVYFYLLFTDNSREIEEKERVEREVNKVLNPPGSEPYPKSKD